MNILKTTAVAALTLTALSTGAAAPERLNVKLGLWEMTSIMRFSGVPPLPKEVLDKMTPQARAKMIADLKAASKEEPEPETSSECITQADLDKPFQSANSEDCKQTIVRTTRTSQEIRMVCTGKTSGSGTFKVNTPTPETMNGTLDLKAGDGPDAFVIKGTIKGRWLGADCGDEDSDDNGDDDEDNAEQ
ncbi:DUF3617 domain-containing protein [Peristeroidobacter soli]|jgi:hypothetical protein|uniref:DUF3617 domain-containing protein n=1 Tax=Peristeroidobacter soli TaxID=2497877 RepID=UPI00101CF647|nr:DUF3617 domain-containing protein [Peristeroidobacter soli]